MSIVSSCGRPESATAGSSRKQYSMSGDALCPKANEILQSARETLEKAQAVEETLRTREQWAQETIESAPYAIITMDERGVITGWNSQAEQTFGWSREEAMGLYLSQTILATNQRQPLERNLRNFVETGEGLFWSIPSEVTAWHRSGREFPAEIAISPMRGHDTWRFNAFMRDISERKRKEQRIEDQLGKAQEAAAAALRAKSEFLANMSHEIRTPMNGILGMADLALETELTSEQHLYLNIVIHSAEALMKIIDDLFDFSTIEARQLKLEQAEFDLHATVDAAIKDLAPLAERKNLALICEFGPGTPRIVIGDAVRLRQILTILLNNGIKFTDSGEVQLRVEQSEQSILHFIVSDTGIGIAEEKQQLIFQAFT